MILEEHIEPDKKDLVAIQPDMKDFVVQITFVHFDKDLVGLIFLADIDI